MKIFRLGDVLSFTDGALLSRDHMGGVYAVAEHMTGQPVWTHQLLNLFAPIKVAILDQHPVLRGVPEFPEIPDGADVEAVVFRWLSEQEDRFGDVWPLVPMAEAPDCSTPFADLVEMTRPDQQIVVVAASLPVPQEEET